jgi:Domain of unknown function (DUF4291)
MRLITEPYLTQVNRLPKVGNHILAQFDKGSIVVYQAYRSVIGKFAATQGYFGGEFSFERMSWIKPNFLWMMYRSGWGTKVNQEITLAIWLKRSAFDDILAQAVHSTFVPEIYARETDWKKAVQRSNVRLQWDPDHNPLGAKLARRAIQLGLRGDVLKAYAQEWIIEIEDISDFVQQQRQNIVSGCTQLITPRETVYPVSNLDTTIKLELAPNPACN